MELARVTPCLTTEEKKNLNEFFFQLSTSLHSVNACPVVAITTQQYVIFTIF